LATKPTQNSAKAVQLFRSDEAKTEAVLAVWQTLHQTGPLRANESAAVAHIVDAA
jgi:hypothetical protein